MDRVLLRTDFSLQCSKPNAEIDLMAVRTILLVRSAYGCWTGSSDGWMRVGYTVFGKQFPIEFIVATYEKNLHYCKPRAINNRSGVAECTENVNESMVDEQPRQHSHTLVTFLQPTPHGHTCTCSFLAFHPFYDSIYCGHQHFYAYTKHKMFLNYSSSYHLFNECQVIVSDDLGENWQ